MYINLDILYYGFHETEHAFIYLGSFVCQILGAPLSNSLSVAQRSTPIFAQHPRLGERIQPWLPFSSLTIALGLQATSKAPEGS